MGNGALCADGQAVRIPVGCQILPFTVFAGSVPFFDTGVSPLTGNTIFPLMTMILPINYRRVGVFFRQQFVGGFLATLGNGQAVSVRQCLGDNAFSPSQKSVFLHAGDPEAFVIDPWYAIVADVVPPANDQIVYSGFEIVKVS